MTRIYHRVAVWVTACLMFHSISRGESSFEIELPDTPSVTETFAAEELTRLIESTGAKGPVVHFSIGKTDHHLALFDGKRSHPEAYVVKVEGGRVSLFGNSDRATLFATYQFLKDIGFRWYFPGALGQVIPELTEIELQNREIWYEPRFETREIDKIQGPHATDKEAMNWVARNRLNRAFSLHRNWREVNQRGGYIKWHRLAHNYEWILPNDKYFEQHPKYYALYHGRRFPVGNESANVCTTNPEVIEIFADYINHWFDQHPDGTVFPISPPDGAARWCECEECQKLGGENFTPGPAGSMTRRQVTFVKAIANKIDKRHADRKILFMAYQNYWEPLGEDPAWPDNVVVQVTRQGDLLRPIQSSDSMRRVLAEWDADGIWDYALLRPESDNPVLYPNAMALGQSVQWLAENGYDRYYFIQAGVSAVHNPLNYWLLAETTWNPDQDLEGLRRQFCEDLYGAAAASMLSFWSQLEAGAQDSAWQPDFWRDLPRQAEKWLTSSLAKELKDKIEQARECELTPSQRQRVELAWEPLQNMIEMAAVDLVPTLSPAEPKTSDKGLWFDDSDRPLLYHADPIIGDSGSLKVRFELKDSVESLVTLLSAGNKGKQGWLQVYISEGRLGWIWEGSDLKGEDSRFFSHLSAETEWQPQVAYEIEIKWRIRSQGESSVELFLDGQMLESRHNSNLAAHFWPDSIGVGCSTAALKSGRFEGWISRVTMRDENAATVILDLGQSLEGTSH